MSTEVKTTTCAHHWRTSWLSREVIVLPAFMAAVLAWGAAHALGEPTLALGVAGALLALVFPLPALVLLSGKLAAPLLGAAFVLQYAGLLAERWYFFAEAKHPQNLYYQAIA